MTGDDPDRPIPSAVERQDSPDARWQAMRHRVLLKADLHCSRCGAEHNKQVVSHVYWDPKDSLPFTPGMKRRPDTCVVTVQVMVVPTSVPWSGEESELEVLCFGCYLVKETERARARRPFKSTSRSMSYEAVSKQRVLAIPKD